MNSTIPDERKPETAAPETITANLRRAFWKGLIIPACLLAFFALAPTWLNARLHSALVEQIGRSNRLTATQKAQQIERFAAVDFRDVCRSDEPEWQSLRRHLDDAGVCGQFARLFWGERLSAVLLAILVGFMGTTLALNRRAKHSRSALISSFRLGWRLSIAAALVQVFLLIPLLAYGIFELTTLAADRYYPQLIAVIVIGGVVALWRSAAIVLKSPRLEFQEPMARAVTPEEAPELWAAVREAAARLKAAPPDHIVIGMQMNFYVTELAVRHDGGVAEGRTLFLSHPLLKQLAPNEVLAIIGHEFGHFIGEDTRLTREFYPLRMKANGTLFTLAQSGWVGWTSVHAMSFFNWCFGGTEQEMSRERELLADRVAASLTSAAVIARALVRFHVVAEAYALSIGGPLEKRPENPLEMPLAAFIREQLVPREAFWRQLFETRTPHPLDSHPALQVRLKALNEPMQPEQAIALATTESVTAYSVWFAGRDALFANLAQQAAEAVKRIRSRADIAHANYQDDSGRQMLDSHFPERRWRVRKTSVVVLQLLFGVVAAAFAAGAVFVPDVTAKVILGAIAVFAATMAVRSWRRMAGSELVLRADRIMFSAWNRPLVFAEIAGLSARNVNGTLVVTFRLKEKAPPIYRGALLRFRRASVSLTLSWFDVKQEELLQLVHRYVTRTVA